MTLDEEVEARIAANIETARCLDAMKPPDPPKEAVMSLATWINQQAEILVIRNRLRQRAKAWRDGPRGD